MSTSLQEQLQHLALPQTKTLADARSRVSILFTRDEASKKSRRIIYEIGLAGLHELAALNPAFNSFEATLFDETTIDLERSVEDKEFNKLLDRNILKFTQHLSPFFLLRPAHMCLEWLLRRFHIHEFNRDALMALALPYHETNTFVLVLQTMRLKQNDSDWGWLKPLSKSGLPVPKSAIINRAASSREFLKFICNATVDAVKELGARANSLQTQINFYTSIVVGALEHAHKVQEWHLITLLPSILKGFKSDVVDFAAATFIIATQLVARTQLSAKLCNGFVERVSAVSLERLRSTAVLLLVLIFETQTTAKPHFSNSTLINLIKQKWFLNVLSTLSRQRIYVYSLCVALLEAAVAAIHANCSESETFKYFLDHMLSDVQLDDVSAQEIIKAFLNTYVTSDEPQASKPPTALKDGDIIELESDDEMQSEQTGFKTWYAGFLRKLEHKYPTAFDAAVKEALQAKTEASENQKAVIKMALNFRLKSLDSNATDLYENLYHHTANIRVFAIQTIVANLDNYRTRPQNFQLLKECLADRVCDDSELVVKEVLKLTTKDFVDVLGVEKFVVSLFAILHKIEQDPQHWSQLTLAVVKHLTTEQVIENYDANLILLSLMSILFPNEANATTRDAIAVILDSPLKTKIKFLKLLKIDGKKNNEFNATEFKKQFLNVISTSNDTPDVMTLFKSVATYNAYMFKDSLQLSHFLMLVTACLKTECSTADSSYICEQVQRLCQNFRIKHLDSKQWMLVTKTQVVPLQLFSDFITTLVRHTKFEQLQNWTQTSGGLKSFLSIFELLAKEALEQPDPKEQVEWFKTLKEVLDTVCETPQAKLEFLVNFYVYEEFDMVKAYPALRIRAFKLLNALCKNVKNKITLDTIHVLKIMIALNSQSEVTRLQAIETLKIIKEHPGATENLQQFIGSILERNYEVGMDSEQFSLILYTILKPANKRQKNAMTKILQDIIKITTADSNLDDPVFIAQILKTLKHINDDKTVGEFIPLAAKALNKTSSDGGLTLLKKPYSTIFQLVCENFDSQNIEEVLMENEEAWNFIEKIFNNHKIFMLQDGKLQSIACILLDIFDEHIYEKMPNKYKVELVKAIIKTVAEADNDTIFLTANKMFKRCDLNCNPLVSILEEMLATSDQTPSVKRKSLTSNKRDTSNSQAQVSTLAWKTGVVLLELLENKKKLTNPEKIIPALFELLRFCLEMEEQSVVEYTKQLTLSILFHCCQLANSAGVDLLKSFPKATFRIDLIVQCVRATQNPQTQHNALLLLSHCAALFPHQVLHNIVDIFTFMGSSVVRHDDAFSFHIINNVIESIIPILVKGKSVKMSAESINTLVIPVLKVFSDILLDVPEHRRQPLYTKLLDTLGAEQYLWIFLCVVFEAHVIDDEKQRLLQKKSKTSPTPSSSPDKFSKRIEICLALANTFEPPIILETCIQLLSYIKGLPLDKDTEANGDSISKKSSTNVEATEFTLFDVKCRTAKHLRHYKYVIMQFLSAISNSPEFLRKVSMLSEEEHLAIKPFYQNFIIKTLSYVPIANAAMEKADEPSQSKFWKVILHHLHDVLDNAISLLSPDMFLIVIHGLMQHQLLSIRKKVIELLINKLQQRDTFFESCEEQNFHNLLTPLHDIVADILQKIESADTPSSSAHHSNDLVFLQQTALIAIKLLSKMCALKYIDEFKNLLVELIKILKHRAHISKIVLATVILTVIEISSNLKAHSLAQLPKYMPLMIDILQHQVELVHQQAPDNVCIAIVTGMQKLFESMPLFLGPYVVDIVTGLSTIYTNVMAQHNDKDQRSTAVLHKIDTIWTKIATEVPVRVLVPSCEKAYKKLIANEHYADIGVLMKLLPECIGKCSPTDLFTVQSELSNFFLNALEFRLQVQQNCELKCINNTEKAVIAAFVAWVLKLSESSFRPICRKIYDWAFKKSTQKETVLTYFSLTSKISEALKSLFVLFAADFIDDIARILNEYNAAKHDIETDAEAIYIETIGAILSTLHNLFLYDSKGFINSHRFEVLMQPIVDQLENRLVLENEDLQQILSASIAQLAVVGSSDIMWKQLNYQVLMKTRTNVPEVRILSFNCCLEIARKLGEDFTPLLPETVPFIAELLEDENQRVEKNTRKAVQELETIVGEPIQL